MSASKVQQGKDEPTWLTKRNEGVKLHEGKHDPIRWKHYFHFVFYFLIPHLTVVTPLRIIYHHILLRFRSTGIVRVLGRPWYSDFMVRFFREFLSQLPVHEARYLHNRKAVFKLEYAKPAYRPWKEWMSYTSEKGVMGRWFAPPTGSRSEDEVVLYFIGGGGFVLATSGTAQEFFLQLVKEMNVKKKIRFSVFQLDYELAPEHRYPSQPNEAIGGYTYLVNHCGISPSKICISGDSAGGNLAISALLHLARQNPKVGIPAVLGPTPPKPAAALLVSPFVSIISTAPSRTTNERYDFISNRAAFHAAQDYIGVPHDGFHPSLNPFHIVNGALPEPPNDLETRLSWDKGLETAKDPYANPVMLQQAEEADWAKDAFPGEGRTMVTWGEKEIFRDDIVSFYDFLESSGVSPTKLVKSLGNHDWPLYEYAVPGLWRGVSTGPERRWQYGVERIAAFLQEIDVANRKQRFGERRRPTDSFVEVPSQEEKKGPVEY